jgi:CRP-like cAMP-binding protein
MSHCRGVAAAYAAFVTTSRATVTHDGMAVRDSMDVFAPMRPLDVRSLAGPALPVSVPAGTSLLHEGHLTGTFYVIRSGNAELWREGRLLGKLGTGDCFGEIDPIPEQPQRYTVIAATAMRLLTFSAFGIGRLCAGMPRMRERIVSFLPDEDR